MANAERDSSSQDVELDDFGRAFWYAGRFVKHSTSSAIQSVVPTIRNYRHNKKITKLEDQLSSIDNPLQYTRLPADKPCIRLLTVEPGAPSDVIRCSFHVVNLDDNPKFTALSYSWDIGVSWEATLRKSKKARSLDDDNVTNAPETKKKILVNNQIAEVQPNLYRLLSQLRQTRPGDYWIDAICMNQNDPIEKIAQLAAMNRVYESASSVLVWLGYCPVLLSPAIRQLLAWCDDPQPGHDLFRKDPTALVAAIYLLSRRWFMRLWVVQEFCLARRITFWLGDHQFTERQIIAILDAVKRVRDVEGLSEFEDVFKEYFTTGASSHKYFAAQVRLRQIYQQGGGRWTLDQWLLASKGREATDPRDLIYGGMALIDPECLKINRDLQLSDKNSSAGIGTSDGISYKLWEKIKVDYQVEAHEVLLNVAACVLSQPDGMRLLSFAARARSGFDSIDECWDPLTKSVKGPLPSWIPNPSSKAANAADIFHDQGGNFAACTTRSNNPKISPDGKALYLDAMCLGTIEGPSYGEENDNGQVLPDEFLQFFIDLPTQYKASSFFPLNNSASYPATTTSTFEAMARVLTAGLARDGDDGSSPSTSTSPSPEQQAANPPMSPESLRIGLCGLLRSHIDRLDREYTPLITDGYRRAAESSASNNSNNNNSNAEEEDELPGHILLDSYLTNQKSLYRQLRSNYPSENWLDSTPSPERRAIEISFARAARRAGGWYRGVRKVSAAKDDEYWYLALTPTWVGARDDGGGEDDVVMLVKGGYVPYVFLPPGKKQREEEEEEEKAKSSRGSGEGEGDEGAVSSCWVLGGEAYVEGLMEGQAAGAGEGWFERIAIV